VWGTTLVKSDLEPGKYSIVVDADAAVAPNSGVVGLRWSSPPREQRVEVRLRGEFEALPTGRAPVEVVENAAMFQRLREAMKVGPTGTVVNPRPAGGTRVHLGSASIGVDVARQGLNPDAMPKDVDSMWRVSLWRADGSRRLLETVQQLPTLHGLQGGSVTFVMRERVEPGKYLLRFSPDPEAAERTTEIKRILGGEMEFEVELTE